MKVFKVHLFLEWLTCPIPSEFILPTSLAKKLEAFSCASSIILSCLSTNLFITSNPLSTTASCTLGFFKTVAAKAGRARFGPAALFTTKETTFRSN